MCHSFLGRSYLNSSTCDGSEERSAGEGSDTSDRNEGQIEAALQQISRCVHSYRLAKFVLENQASVGLA